MKLSKVYSFFVDCLLSKVLRRAELGVQITVYRLVMIFVALSLSSLVSRLSTVTAQEMEYKMELGGAAGGGFYLGDANYSTFYKNTKIAGGLIGRYNLNPRMSLKGMLTYGNVSGNALEQKNKFPDVKDQKWEFNNSLVDLSCTYEISFWGFGTGTGYKGNKRLTPYIQLGLGGTYCNKVFTANIPIGVGVKYKMADRWNMGLDWSMHFSMSDKLDGISDPYKIKSGGLKNKDSYCFTMFYISYDLMPRLRECNNL